MYSLFLTLPDGLKILFCLYEGPAELGELVKESLYAVELFSGKMVVIATDNGWLIPQLAEAIEDDLPNHNLIFGKTKYFELCSDNWPKTIRWSQYSDKFRVTELYPHHPGMELYFALMQNSFGKANRQCSGFDLFLVEEKETGLAVGGFATRYFKGIDEVQLHSVAGRRCDNPRISQAKNKLPILMSAAKQVIPKGKKVTFSSAPVASLYEKLGFKVSSRQGMLIKP